MITTLSIPPPIMTNQLLTPITAIKSCGVIMMSIITLKIVTDSNQIFEQDSNADSVVNFDVDIITDHMKGDQ